MFDLALYIVFPCLNIGKSGIIPMTHPTPQEWCVWMGCMILQGHETTKYLGCLTRFHVRPRQEVEFVLGMVRKHLNQWANRSLYFAGRTILLRHVIRVMLVYHFMLMSMNPLCYK